MNERSAPPPPKRSGRLLSCTGPLLRRVIEASAHWLEQHQAAIDALNVFPVPDGDTGRNMYLTLRAATSALQHDDSPSASAIALTAARGALLGARGNSGVILSQILAGFAAGLHERQRFDASGMADAFDEAVAYAYRAVTQPVEGTMLTVSRDAAAAVRVAADGGANLSQALEVAASAARDSVARGPEYLPVLREAGVVDAGGEGLRVILDGSMRFANHRSLVAPSDLEIVEPRAVSTLSSAHALDDHGYCVNFVVRGADLDAADLRDDLGKLGASLLVVGDSCLVRAHVHTERPGDALNAGALQGELTGIEIANMRDQVADRERAREAVSSLHGATRQRSDPSERDAPSIAVVAIAPSRQLADLMASLGARTISGGQTMNPSAQEILQAIRETGADAVIVLPNNRNILLAAKQAADVAEKETERRVVVVPAVTLPAGLAACLAFSPAASLEENAAAMERAAARVDTVELTFAARASSIHGLIIKKGDVIGLVNDELTARGDSLVPVALNVLDTVVTVAEKDHSLVTVYTGEGATPSATEALQTALAERYPRLSVEIVDGGQPHYPYMLGLE